MMMLLQTNGMSADTLGHLNAEGEVLIVVREKENWSKNSLFKGILRYI